MKRKTNEEVPPLKKHSSNKKPKKVWKFFLVPDLTIGMVKIDELSQYKNYRTIKNGISEWNSEDPIPVDLHPRLIQRSDAWFKMKCDFRGSDLSNLTGIWLEKACTFFKYVYKKESLQDWVKTIQKQKKDLSHIDYKLQWGILHEANGIKGLLDIFNENQIDITVVESGSYKVKINEKLTFISSPDGLFHCKRMLGLVEDFTGVIEIKCRTPYQKKSNGDGFFYDTGLLPVTSMPHYYIQQVQGEMFATDTYYALFISYTPKAIRIFLVERDDEYIDLMKQILVYINKIYRKQNGCDYVLSGDITHPYSSIEDVYERFLQKTKELKELSGSEDTPQWYKEY